MAFNAGVIQGWFRIDAKGADHTLGKTGKKVGGLEKQFKGLGTTMKAAFGVAAVAGVVRMGKALNNAANAGAKFSTQMAAFQRVAAGKGISGDGMLKQVRDISSALSTTQIITAANQLELLGVGMQNLPRFTEIARAAAVGLGEDVGRMLESISTGTARQSKLWLDNLGIIIDVESANESYAASLGKTASALTDTEKRAAFLNAVLQRGDDVINTVGAESETSAEMVSSLGVAFEDLNLQLKTMAAHVAAKPFSKLAAEIKETNDELARPGSNKLLTLLAGLVPGLNKQRRENRTTYFEDVPGIGQAAARGRFTPRPEAPAPAFVPPSVAAPFGPNIPFSGQSSILGTGDQRTLTVEQIDKMNKGLITMKDVAGDSKGAIVELTSQVDLLGTAANGIGDAFSAAFRELATGSGQAGRAFAAGLSNAVANVARTFGKFFIQVGIGMQAIKMINPVLAIAAGIALQALAGLFQGIGENQFFTPAAAQRELPGDERRGERSGPATTVIVQGDVFGDPVFVERLGEIIRRHTANSGFVIQAEAS